MRNLLQYPITAGEVKESLQRSLEIVKARAGIGCLYPCVLATLIAQVEDDDALLQQVVERLKV